MSVEMIAETLLRKSKPFNSYLRRWAKELADADQRQEEYSKLKFENVQWTTRKPLENRYDQAVYDLARSLVEHRQNDGLRDGELSLAVLKFQQEMTSIDAQKRKLDAFRRYVLPNKWRR